VRRRDAAAGGVGADGPDGGLIVVDVRGAALSPWITAMDSRCGDSSRALTDAVGPRIRRLSTSAPFQAERIHWLQQSGGLPDDCMALLLPAYVASRLAARGLAAAFCERTCTAGRAGDVVAMQWDDELVAAANWSPHKLPRIVATGAPWARFRRRRPQ